MEETHVACQAALSREGDETSCCLYLQTGDIPYAVVIRDIDGPTADPLCDNGVGL